MDDLYKSVSKCRICHSNNIDEVLDLGSHPPANSLYKRNTTPPKAIPLRLLFCNDCSTVQLGEDVDPKYLFQNYVWVTGTSKATLEYSQLFADKLISRIGKKPEEIFVVEVASNDGTFLKPFKNKKSKVLGIDPAKNIAKIANEENIETLDCFFNLDVAKEIKNSYRCADIIFARNVIPHVKEIHSVISGMSEILTDEGFGVIEFHNAGLILKENQYDYIYHEHLFYFTLKTIKQLLKIHNLNIFDVEYSEISGGALVVYFSKNKRKKSDNFLKLINFEKDQAINVKETWKSFSINSKNHSQKLKKILLEKLPDSEKILAYGASARSSTILNYSGINSNHITQIIDKNSIKQGLLTAGSNIPIISFEDSLDILPTTGWILLLAWNFKAEIIKELRNNGFCGSFIIPLPNEPYIE